MAALALLPRVLLKLSGEALAGEQGIGLDFHVVEAFADEIKARRTRWASQLGLVIGGGNIVRGASASRDGHGPRRRRLHGDARHGDQRAGGAGRAREDGIDTRVMTAIRME